MHFIMLNISSGTGTGSENQQDPPFLVIFLGTAFLSNSLNKTVTYSLSFLELWIILCTALVYQAPDLSDFGPFDTHI